MDDPRIHRLNDAPARDGGDYVLYWMIAARRTRHNPALERAAAVARASGRPLVVLEALRIDAPHASDRTVRAVLDGMTDQRDALRARATYYPYIERAPGQGRGLVEALAQRAVTVVTDHAPLLFLPRMTRRIAARLEVRVEAVDGWGVVPLSAPQRLFDTALSWRAWFQREGHQHLRQRPAAHAALDDLPPPVDPPREIVARWPTADDLIDHGDLSALPIRHDIRPIAQRGGERAAWARLAAFVDGPLDTYGDRPRALAADATSGLSGDLHWGHLSPWAVLDAIAARFQWSVPFGAKSRGGKKEGWWQLPPPVEAYLDELVTWREIGALWADRRADAATFDALPPWAKATLAAHHGDTRSHRYDRSQFEQARTHDPLWNAAQRQLVREGRIASTLRMLWGKKVLEWSATPEEAFDTLLTLNDRYAIDGRDPNSVTGVAWVFGRFDRPWPPDKPVIGTLRPMSSEATARKMATGEYLRRYGG